MDSIFSFAVFCGIFFRIVIVVVVVLFFFVAVTGDYIPRHASPALKSSTLPASLTTHHDINAVSWKRFYVYFGRLLFDLNSSCELVATRTKARIRFSAAIHK